MRPSVADWRTRGKRVLLATLRRRPDPQPDPELFLLALGGSARCHCGAQEVRCAEAGPEEDGAGPYGFYVFGRRLIAFPTAADALHWLDVAYCSGCISASRGRA